MVDPCDDCQSLVESLKKQLDEAQRMLRGCEARCFAHSDKLRAIKRGPAKRLTRKAFYELRAEIGL